jgi:hypothetical protein
VVPRTLIDEMRSMIGIKSSVFLLPTMCINPVIAKSATQGVTTPTSTCNSTHSGQKQGVTHTHTLWVNLHLGYFQITIVGMEDTEQTIHPIHRHRETYETDSNHHRNRHANTNCIHRIHRRTRFQCRYHQWSNEGIDNINREERSSDMSCQDTLQDGNILN